VADFFKAPFQSHDGSRHFVAKTVPIELSITEINSQKGNFGYDQSKAKVFSYNFSTENISYAGNTVSYCLKTPKNKISQKLN